MAPEHIPTSNTCKWRIISLPSPHVPDMGCVWFLVVFSISWRGELGAGSRTHELVVLVLARSGSAGTFWGELWALWGHRWHSKAWTWSWTPQKCGKGHLNPSQEPVIKWKYSLGAGEEQSFKDKNELHGICGKAGGHWHNKKKIHSARNEQWQQENALVSNGALRMRFQGWLLVMPVNFCVTFMTFKSKYSVLLMDCQKE